MSISSRVFSEDQVHRKWWDWEPHPRLHPQVMVTWPALRSSFGEKTNNMDAAVAGKRKHFDTDEDASNRKVAFSLTSRQTLILTN